MPVSRRSPPDSRWRKFHGNRAAFESRWNPSSYVRCAATPFTATVALLGTVQAWSTAPTFARSWRKSFGPVCTASSDADSSITQRNNRHYVGTHCGLLRVRAGLTAQRRSRRVEDEPGQFEASIQGLSRMPVAFSPVLGELAVRVGRRGSKGDSDDLVVQAFGLKPLSRLTRPGGVAVRRRTLALVRGAKIQTGPDLPARRRGAACAKRRPRPMTLAHQSSGSAECHRFRDVRSHPERVESWSWGRSRPLLSWIGDNLFCSKVISWR